MRAEQANLGTPADHPLTGVGRVEQLQPLPRISRGFRAFLLGAFLLGSLTSPASTQDAPGRPLPTAATVTAAEQELRDLRTALDSSDQDVPNARQRMEFWDIPTRLSIFEMHFGIEPSKCPGWDELSETARRIQASLAARFQLPYPDVGLKDGWNGVVRSTIRAVLLDLSGQGVEARRILFEPNRDPNDLVDHEMVHHRCCFMCVATDSQVEALAQSVFLQREGDLPGALRLMHTAALEDGHWCGQGRGSMPEFLVRYGLLLAANNHATEAETVFHYVREQFPRAGDVMSRRALTEMERSPDEFRLLQYASTSASDIAGAALERMGRPRDAQGTLYRSAALSPQGWEREAAVFLGRPGVAQPILLLAVRLADPEGDHKLWDSTYSTWTIDTGFADALPRMRELLEIDDGERRTLALAILLAVDPGARHEIPAFMERLFHDERELSASTDEVLRLIHAGGPELPRPIGECSPREFRTAWKVWWDER
ncbi:MAG TPA: hypothetical protein VFD43_08110 [Planctomycetota bacterium]|nr:hypothetical protein [Planctomycetota bacterium]